MTTTRNIIYTFIYLIKELFARRAGLDGKLQLSVHGSDADIHLRGEEDSGKAISARQCKGRGASIPRKKGGVYMYYIHKM